MSRLFKLIKKENKEESSHSSQSETESEPIAKPSFNFNLLSDNVCQSAASTDQESYNDEQVSYSKPQTSKSNKPKKSQKRAKKSPNKQENISPPVNLTLPELIDKYIKIDSRRLNMENEHKQIFKYSSSRRGPPKKHIFGDPLPEFARLYKNPGLYMQMEEDEKKVSFMFSHGKSYQTEERHFRAAVHSNMPDLLNMRHLPLNVNTLLYLSGMYTLQNNSQSALSYLEFALFVCKMSLNVRFNITSPVYGDGRMRVMEYSVEENRPFFLALYKYMEMAIHKMCFKTALELAKLIFTLDPVEDPLGIMLIIDYLALKAKDYHFLVELYDNFKEVKNLHLLPNFAFSVPIARYSLPGDKNTDLAIGEMITTLSTFPTLLTWLTGVSTDTREKTYLPLLDCLIILVAHRSQQFLKDLSSPANNLLRIAKDGLGNDIESSIPNRVNYEFFPRSIARHLYLSQVPGTLEFIKYALRREEVIYDYDPFPPIESRTCSSVLINSVEDLVLNELRLRETLIRIYEEARDIDPPEYEDVD